MDSKTERYIKKFINPALAKLGMKFDVDTQKLNVEIPIDYVTQFNLTSSPVINEFIETFGDKRKLAMLFKIINDEVLRVQKEKRIIDKRLN
jgi:hypothetical protein